MLTFLLAVAEASSSTAYPAYDLNGNVMGYYDTANGDSVAEFEYGPFGPNDSRWFNDKIIEFFRGERERRIYYHP